MNVEMVETIGSCVFALLVGIGFIIFLIFTTKVEDKKYEKQYQLLKELVEVYKSRKE